MRPWLAAVAIIAACAPKQRSPEAPKPEPVQVDYDSAGAVPPPATSDDAPFYPDAEYDEAITHPRDVLGHPIGARPAPPEQIVATFRRWAEESPRVQIATYATTYEGRELVRAVISSPDNIERLDEILADVARLADPRGLADAEAERIVSDGPAIAWFGYSIHGDEVSGADASLAFGHHLIAARDQEVERLLDRVVVIIDPVMNPDGRARTVNDLLETRSRRDSENYKSLHRGKWPYGRGNHYLFDLNRDWLIGVHPETRGRWREIQAFNPQLIVDAHEMGALDTYLFSPESEPHNPNLPEWHQRWYRAFSNDLAGAFDRRGWAYYTREWADGWFPGYTTTWGQLLGAVTFLYEQSSTTGLPLRRPSGQRITYRHSVRGHAVSSLVNLRTLANNRESMLRDYLAHRRAAVDAQRHDRAFALVPGRNPDRERKLLRVLVQLGVEVHRTDGALTARNVIDVLGQETDDRRLPAGTYLVPEAQPHGPVVRALLEPDPHIPLESLRDERRELERKGQSKIYDVTAWNLPQSFAVDALWLDTPGVARTRVTELPEADAGIAAAEGEPYGWIVDGRQDASVAFAARAVELGLQVHLGDEPFETGGTSYPRGTVLVRVAENPPDTAELVEKAASFVGVAAQPVATGRAPGEGPDLGGTHFHRLDRPRVAMLANAPVSTTSFGHLWHHLDQEVKLPLTFLDTPHLDSHDLRRYNVIVVPSGRDALAAILRLHAESLAAWVKQGGTLVAIGRSAATLTDEKIGLSSVRRRRDVLDQLGPYRAAARRGIEARTIEIDEEALWEGTGVEEDTDDDVEEMVERIERATRTQPEGAPKQGERADEPEAQPTSPPTSAEKEDAWRRRFSPQGAMLRGLVAPEHWITAGAPDEMPVLFGGDSAYLATEPVVTAVRLASGKDLRLSGLLWPEARTRLAYTAYLTVESKGRGQVILFATDPVHRGMTHGTARILSNAVVYGPSMGADQPLTW